jgi:hypothetical protein
MVLIPETPIRGYKEASNYIVGSVIRHGLPRALESNGDSLTFTISKDAKSDPLLTKTTVSGIEQSDNGVVVVFLARSDVTNEVFPEEEYWYLLRIDEGDSGDSFPVQCGPMILLDLP